MRSAPQESMIGEECYVTAGGQRIRVNVHHGTGVPLVLCNGIGASLEVLDPLVEYLDQFDIGVVRFDVPGTGGGAGRFRFKIGGLQRRWSGLIGRLCRRLFAALQALAHPFTHARLLTQKRGWDQSSGPHGNLPCQPRRDHRRDSGKSSLQWQHGSDPLDDSRREIPLAGHVP